MVTVAPAAVRVSGRRSRASAARTRRKDLPGASGRKASARDSAMYCGGTRSTVRPMALAAFRVAGPMVAMCMGVAPRASSWAARSEAWWRVRVMRMRLLVRVGILWVLYVARRRVTGCEIVTQGGAWVGFAGVLHR